MELIKAKDDEISKMVKEWTEHHEQELEATFRMTDGREVDRTAFLEVAKRLKAKYKETPQLERLTVTVLNPSTDGLRRQSSGNARFTLEGTGVLLQYCEDNTMAGKPFEAIIKDRAGPASNIDIEDYNTRVKVRREVPLSADDPRVQALLTNWNNLGKAFRLIKRWSYSGDGLQFDLSMVYSTSKSASGEFLWKRNYLDEKITENEPTYEIEVELKRTDANANPAVAKSTLIKGMVDILRGLQKNAILIRNKTRNDVLANYVKLVGRRAFRGVSPNTLEMKSFVKANVAWETSLWDGYNVTDKADGLRVHAYCDPRGELFLLDMSLNVYRTGLLKEACKDSLLDCEWVTIDKTNNPILQLLVFDCYVINGKVVDALPFQNLDNPDVDTRYSSITAWVKTWNDPKTGGPTKLIKSLTPSTMLQVSRKQFEFAPKGSPEIFTRCASTMLDEAARSRYNTDGLIFTPNMDPLPNQFGGFFAKQFKWKPAKDNTIDFLVTIVKDKDTGKDLTRPLIREGGDVEYYKTLRLMVGHDAHPAWENPRQALLYERPLPGQRLPGGKPQVRDYRPIEFTPQDFPDPDNMASTCYMKVHYDPKTNKEFIVTEDGEPIQTLSIVEFRYDTTVADPGWKWKPVRVRDDKTQRFQRKEIGRTLNSEDTAEGVWNSIHDPITETMIRTGSLIPSTRELISMAPKEAAIPNDKGAYYQRKATASDLFVIRGLRDFHNLYIKERILLWAGLGTGGKTICDLSVGQGSDIGRWIRSKVKFAYGQDIDAAGIINPRSGAYRRYLKEVLKGRKRGEPAPPMVFAVGDSTKNIAAGAAGETDIDNAIMATVFGKGTTATKVPAPPFVVRNANKVLQEGADCTALMFTIHYMFENKEKFDGLLYNLHNTVKLGGYFVGCCFDGDTVFEAFREANIKKGGKLFGQDENGRVIWSITRSYDADELPKDDEGFGKAIDVEFISIGSKQTEWLVPFDLLVKKMKLIGLDLMTPEECKAVGLQESTNMFSKSWTMAKDSGRLYEMSDDVKRYSFFNRWFIFKRNNMINTIQEKKGEAVETKEEEPFVPPLPPGPPPPLPAVEQKPGMPGSTAVLRAEATEFVPPGMARPGPPPPSKRPAPVRRGGSEKEEDAETILPKNAEDRTFEVNDLYQFHIDAPVVDKLGLGDPGAGRWLAPISRFPIYDGDDEYPSLEHYIAAMKYKYGAKRSDGTEVPQLAKGLFGQAGTIHQRALRYQSVQTGDKDPTDEQLSSYLSQEMSDIQKQLRPAGFKANKVVFDEAAWLQHRDEVLREGVKQRWENDARFRRALEAIRKQGKYLLYYTGASGTSDLGGIRRVNKKIDGNNRLGRVMMEIAGFLDA